MKHSLNFYTSYHQFYIIDKDSFGDTGAESFWTTEAHEARLAMNDGVLGVSTQCYGTVKGELVLMDAKPSDEDLHLYDHIVEGGINIQSGFVQIMDCPFSNIELELPINPGTYRVRILSSNLASVLDDDGDDYYIIKMWPSSEMERTLLKQYR